MAILNQATCACYIRATASLEATRKISRIFGSSGFCVLSVERPRRPRTCPRTPGILRFSPAAWLKSTCNGYPRQGTTRACFSCYWPKLVLAQAGSDKCRGLGGRAPKRDAGGLVHPSEPDLKPSRQRRKSTQKPDGPQMGRPPSYSGNRWGKPQPTLRAILRPARKSLLEHILCRR